MHLCKETAGLIEWTDHHRMKSEDSDEHSSELSQEGERQDEEYLKD